MSQVGVQLCDSITATCCIKTLLRCLRTRKLIIQSEMKSFPPQVWSEDIHTFPCHSRDVALLCMTHTLYRPRKSSSIAQVTVWHSIFQLQWISIFQRSWLSVVFLYLALLEQHFHHCSLSCIDSLVKKVCSVLCFSWSQLPTLCHRPVCVEAVSLLLFQEQPFPACPYSLTLTSQSP